MLRKLYMLGPAWAGWGFWEGRALDDICAELTHVDASHWRDEGGGSEQCEALIERKVIAFSIGVAAVFVMAATIAVCTHSLSYCFTVRPMLNRIDAVLRSVPWANNPGMDQKKK